MAEHMKMSALYWSVTSSFLLGQENNLDSQGILAFVKTCHNEDGGFSASTGHDSHILYTLSAIQILRLIGKLDEFNFEKTIECM